MGAQVLALIKATYAALAGVDSDGVVEATDDIQKPTAGQIRKSITPDGLVSFLDGKSYKTLKRHLGTHGLTIEEYKARFSLGPGCKERHATEAVRFRRRSTRSLQRSLDSSTCFGDP